MKYLFQSKHNLAKHGECCIKVGNTDVKPSASVQIQVYTWTEEMPVRSMHFLRSVHFTSDTSAGLAVFLPSDLLQGIVTAFVLSNSDHYNALLSYTLQHIR